MCTELRTLADSRRNVLRAALELGEGIAAVRRRLDRARGVDPNSPDFNALKPETPDGSLFTDDRTTESA